MCKIKIYKKISVSFFLIDFFDQKVQRAPLWNFGAK